MAEEHEPDFAELLRRARRAAGVTQEELAERAGLSARAISALERGVNRAPRRDTLDMLADALGLDAAERRRWERLRREQAVRAGESGETAPTPAPALSGTLTFLFTDIEASTDRWERFPQRMPDNLVRYAAILRSAIASCGGTVFKTLGDALCAAFPTAPAALEAALSAQRALVAEEWGGAGPLRVRMALHSGQADLRERDYVGLPLNRVTRILAAGHGGQVLLSLAAQQLVRDHLPTGVQLRDLGEGGLRGLLRREPIYQVVAPDLPADFPPLRDLDATDVEPLAGATRPAARNPYKGLRAFQEADAGDFFGREALAQRLLERLGEQVPLRRFMVVVGPSGSGKSSVVRAGLLPLLKRGALPGSERWVVVDIIPGARPLEELEAALLRICANPPASLLEQLLADERGLLRAAKRALPEDEAVELLLLIDQFEEVFTLIPDEPARVHFLESLSAAVRDPRSRVRVVCTLRADFYDRPLLYPDPGEMVRQRTEVVLPLTTEELHRAIVGPAQRVGVAVEPELVAAIIRDVGEQPGTLPLLQYALTELFERRSSNLLTLASYQQAGGLLGALSRRAEELYAGLAGAEQAVARQVLLRLVVLGEGQEDTRRRVRLSELRSLAVATETLEGVLELFGAARLLTFDRDAATGEGTVAVAHEALLRSWGRLRGWLEEDRAGLRLHRQLTDAAQEWHALGQDEGLLYRGARLELAREWRTRHEAALNDLERAFLDASTANEERDRQTRQRQQRQRLLVLSGSLVVVTLFALGAVAQWIRAQQAEQGATAATRQAISRELAAKALALQTADPQGDAQLWMLLAREALRRADTAEAREALRALLFTVPAHAFQPPPPDTEIVPLTHSADFSVIVTSRLPGKVTVWDVNTGEPIAELMPPDDPGEVFVAAAISPDKRLIATVSDGTTSFIRVWNIADKQQLYLRQTKGPHQVFGAQGLVAFNPAGTRLLVQGTDEWLILDAVSGQQLATAGEVTVEFPSFGQWSPDGTIVVTAQAPDVVNAWDANTGQQIASLPLPRGMYPGAVKFSPDSTRAILIPVFWDDPNSLYVQVYDLRSGSSLLSIPFQISMRLNSSNLVNALAFTPDSQAIVFGPNEGDVQLWDIQTQQVIRTFQGQQASSATAAVSPDGLLLFVAGQDGVARVWDIASGALLATMHAIINEAHFSADGKWLMTVTDPGWIRAFSTSGIRASSPEILAQVDLVITRDFTPEERAKYLH
jgi:class 3 adenylate cyclase/WD40 repeat protein